MIVAPFPLTRRGQRHGDHRVKLVEIKIVEADVIHHALDKGVFQIGFMMKLELVDKAPQVRGIFARPVGKVKGHRKLAAVPAQGSRPNVPLVTVTFNAKRRGV